jgi:hypothetical protein
METRRFAPLYTPASSATPGSLLPSVTVVGAITATASAVFTGMLNNQFVQIQIANQSTAWAFVNFGVFGSVTPATVAASFPVAPNASVIVSVSNEVTGASVILATGTGNVTFTRGEGI